MKTFFETFFSLVKPFGSDRRQRREKRDLTPGWYSQVLLALAGWDSGIGWKEQHSKRQKLFLNEREDKTLASSGHSERFVLIAAAAVEKTPLNPTGQIRTSFVLP